MRSRLRATPFGALPWALAAAALLAVLVTAGCSYQAPFMGGDGEWHVAAFGSQSIEDNIAVVDDAGTARDDVLGGWQIADVGSIDDISSVTFEAGPTGKISNDEDGWQVLYTEIDPLEENFKISAAFRIVEVGERAGNQTGFGVFAADVPGLDSAQHQSGRYRYFNSISCLAMPAQDGVACMRGVYGYVNPDTSDAEPMRRTNLAEQFPSGLSFEEGAVYRFCLEKTDDGFTGRFGSDELSLEDSGFVAVQDADHMCVGVMASRNVTVEVTDVQFESSEAGPNAKVKTADDIEGSNVDYASFAPADERPIQEIIASSAMAIGDGDLVCVAPEGEPDGLGTTTYPLDLATAVSQAEAGQTIVLKPGTYPLDETLRLDASGSEKAPIRFAAAGKGTAVFEGAGIELAGDWWHLRNLEVVGADGVGLHIEGNDNVVERCEVHGCGDSGVLVAGDLDLDDVELREQRASWPSRNLVINCDSYDNCDPARQDADGFAAKLACGEGNVFYGCLAHHNVDDGWDLYSKALLGPTGAVRIENCVAYGNGHTTADEEAGSFESGEGNGFKLGGPSISVEHVLVNSVAAGNNHYGIITNAAVMKRIARCTLYDNGDTNCDARDHGLGSLQPIEDSILLPGPSTAEDDVLENVSLRGENTIIEQSEVGEADREVLALEYLESLDVSAVDRDADGNLSLNGAFESKNASGARF